MGRVSIGSVIILNSVSIQQEKYIKYNVTQKKQKHFGITDALFKHVFYNHFAKILVLVIYTTSTLQMKESVSTKYIETVMLNI